MSKRSLRGNREFLKNAWSITHDLSNLLLLKPISINFLMIACILLLTLTELSLFPFFSFDSCCLSRSRMFNLVVLLVVSNGDSALFSSSPTSCLNSCCEILTYLSFDETSTEEDCNSTRSRHASAKWRSAGTRANLFVALQLIALQFQVSQNRIVQKSQETESLFRSQ